MLGDARFAAGRVRRKAVANLSTKQLEAQQTLPLAKLAEPFSEMPYLHLFTLFCCILRMQKWHQNVTTEKTD